MLIILFSYLPLVSTILVEQVVSLKSLILTQPVIRMWSTTNKTQTTIGCCFMTLIIDQIKVFVTIHLCLGRIDMQKKTQDQFKFSPLINIREFNEITACWHSLFSWPRQSMAMKAKWKYHIYCIYLDRLKKIKFGIRKIRY